MNRKGFIGGSDVVRLQDHSKWHEIWEVKTGRKRPVDLSDNLAVQMGVNTENFNIEWFFKMMGDAVKLNRSLKQHTFSKNYKGVLLKGTVDLANSIEPLKLTQCIVFVNCICHKYKPICSLVILKNVIYQYSLAIINTIVLRLNTTKNILKRLWKE